jgi:23S rRNA (guanosine2251-2'-O)-methyltransferase
MPDLAIIAHNLRSSHNVGSLLRTCDGLGVQKVYLTGYTPYPLKKQDSRLPHIAAKVNKAIIKTALGAENTIEWQNNTDIFSVIIKLRREGYTICALEQTKQALPLPDFIPPQKVAIIIGREVEGIEQEVLDTADAHIVIPMFGKKESFNVVQAAAIALYAVRFAAS